MSRSEGSTRERITEVSLGASPFVVTIDHRFIDSGLEEIAQEVYDALGTLDALAPAAVATIGRADLLALVDASDRWLASGPDAPERRVAVMDASRRLRHLLERR